jgi:branched-chain amino acid transport system permease protein
MSEKFMEYLIHIGILIGIYAILVVSLNLVVGYTGLVSVAQAGFFGIGAYTVGILTTRYSWGFFEALLTGVLLAILVSLLIGFVLSRFRDDYFMLISLGFMVIVNSVFINWSDVTNGALGIAGISLPEIAVTSELFFLVVLLVLLGVYGLCWFIVRSPFGRVLRTIREDEQAIQIFGFVTLSYKLLVFSICAGIAGVAGGFFASYITYIDPTSFTIQESVLILTMVILGGTASIKGSLAGAAILVVLPEALRFLGLPDVVAGQLRQVIYGLLLIAFMAYKPQGLFGAYRL